MRLLQAKTESTQANFTYSFVGNANGESAADGRCHISCEMVGDPSDRMTTQREAIFKPLGLELTRQMEAVMCRTPEDAGSVDIPPRPLETKEMIESKLIPCERCGTCAIQFAPRPVCYEALSLTEIDIWPSGPSDPHLIRKMDSDKAVEG